MSTFREDLVTCPYCGWKDEDSWEYGVEEEEHEVVCPDCDKIFILEVCVSVTYSTERTDCENENHEWGEPEYFEIDQDTCDRWNAENFSGKSNHTPYRSWSRKCKNCEESDYVKLEVGSDMPEEWK